MKTTEIEIKWIRENWPACPSRSMTDHVLEDLADLAAARAEIERLNGRRCDTCYWNKFVHGENSENPMVHCIVKGDIKGQMVLFPSSHYCKAWGKR